MNTLKNFVFKHLRQIIFGWLILCVLISIIRIINGEDYSASLFTSNLSIIGIFISFWYSMLLLSSPIWLGIIGLNLFLSETSHEKKAINLTIAIIGFLLLYLGGRNEERFSLMFFGIYINLLVLSYTLSVNKIESKNKSCSIIFLLLRSFSIITFLACTIAMFLIIFALAKYNLVYLRNYTLISDINNKNAFSMLCQDEVNTKYPNLVKQYPQHIESHVCTSSEYWSAKAISDCKLNNPGNSSFCDNWCAEDIAGRYEQDIIVKLPTEVTVESCRFSFPLKQISSNKVHLVK